MANEVFRVEGMSCQHCVKSIEKAVGELAGVDKVCVDLQEKKVTVEFSQEKITVDSIKETIEEQGYDVL